MALAAVLEFGDNHFQRYSKQYLVTDCKFLFDRSYNNFRTEGAARCERMELEIVAPGKTDLQLFEWYISKGVMNGRLVIEFSGPDVVGETVQVIKFEDATCFALSENYEIGSFKRRTVKLSISAEEITIGDVSFKQI